MLIFAAGEPDFDTPAVVVEAAIEALRKGETRYKPALGDAATRQAVATKLTEHNRIPGLSAEHVAITFGVKQALFNACQCLFDHASGQDQSWEALLPVPAWLSYRPIVELAGGRVVPMPTTMESGFKVTPQQLRAAIGPRARAVMLNSPGNPTGAVYSPAELNALAEVIDHAARTIAPDLVVVSDEIYEHIIFHGSQHLSPGAIPSIAPRTVTLNGLSKSGCMTGWRAGYAACPGDFGRDFIAAMGRMQEQSTSNVTAFVMPAMRAALTQIQPDLARMRERFEARADMIMKGLGSIPGLRVPRIQGAFYAFPDVSSFFGRRTPKGTLLKDSTSMCEALLNEAHVAVIPGCVFEGCGDQHIRLSFACSESQISEGVDRMARFFGTLSRG